LAAFPIDRPRERQTGCRAEHSSPIYSLIGACEYWRMLLALRRLCLLTLCVLCGALYVIVAHAKPACPAGNLLARVSPVSSDMPLRDAAARLVDGVIVRNGLVWPRRANLVTLRKGSITYDLGAEVPLRTVYVQLDADQAATIQIAGEAVKWQTFAVPAHATASGMLMRVLALPGVGARYVRLLAANPQEPLALTEFGASCDEDFVRKTEWRVVGLPPDRQLRWFARLWLKLTGKPALGKADGYVVQCLIVVTALLVAWRIMRAPRRWLDVALAGLAVVSAMAYSNFGAYHYPDFIHSHDVFHYFVGAKYFKELHYTDLYDCATVAEIDAGFEQRVFARAQRDLHTNDIVPGRHAFLSVGHCHERFSAARWDAFADDVAYFANRCGIEGWHKVVYDHGFNASPVWIALGASLASELPARSWSIGEGDSVFSGLIGPLDPLLLLIALGAVVWAFGWRTACFVVMLFGCNPLSQFLWVGGGFLRQAWLATLIVGLCLVHKQRWFGGGVLLGCSALLQVFPAVTLLAPLLGVTVACVRRRRPERADLWILCGAITAAVLLVPLSNAICGTPDVWKLFYDNSLKHVGTAAANVVGLPMALSFRFAQRGAALFDASQVDPFAAVRAARAATLAAMRPVQIILAGLGVLMVARRLGRVDRACAACLCLVLLPLFTDESCYYFVWVACLGICWAQRPLSVLLLLTVLAGTLCILLLVPGADVPYAYVSRWLVCGLLAFALLAPVQFSRDVRTLQVLQGHARQK
jgi:hypothetical protein